MIGGGLSYDVYVPCEDKWQASIWRDKGFYNTFVDATQPESIKAMSKGWARYEAFLAHERDARRRALTIAESVFPELATYRAQGHDVLPMLWVNNLLPVETSSEITIEV
jgi:hypothetical protein